MICYKQFDFGTGSLVKVNQSSVSSFSSALPQILYLQRTNRIMEQIRRKVTRGKRMTLHSLKGSEVTVPLLTVPLSPIAESSLRSSFRELVVSFWRNLFLNRFNLFGELTKRSCSRIEIEGIILELSRGI